MHLARWRAKNGFTLGLALGFRSCGLLYSALNAAVLAVLAWQKLGQMVT
jgi:sulfite exporter TauE/SafE